MVEPTFCHRRCIWISKRYVFAVLLSFGLYRPTSLSDVHLARLIKYAVCFWRTQSQLVLHRTEEAGELSKRQANYSDVTLMKLSADPTCVIWTYGSRTTEVGLSLGCVVRTSGLRARLICMILQPFSPKVVLRNSNSSWRLPLSHIALDLCTEVERTACILEGW